MALHGMGLVVEYLSQKKAEKNWPQRSGGGGCPRLQQLNPTERRPVESLKQFRVEVEIEVRTKVAAAIVVTSLIENF